MLYDRSYYESTRPAAAAAAAVLVPLLNELIRPHSVLDVGCGDGTWLAAYHQIGVTDYLGVDISTAGGLHVPTTRFARHDLTGPLELGRRFDLVQSLATAEHLPPKAAPVLVRSLVRHGDAVLFSAAVPGQGGTGHAHEQWPDYWADLFRREGFEVYDCVRPRVWADARVAWWYAQNCLLFVRSGSSLDWVRRLPLPAPVGPILRLLHPGQRTAVNPVFVTHPSPDLPPVRPYDVAVVIPTVGRATLERAVRAVYAQDFPGTIQVLIGVDTWSGESDRGALAALAAAAPPGRTVTVFDPGYSTAVRNGGFTPAGTGGALRTVLSYAAHSRLVAYLDDDNWWAPDHLSSLVRAVAGHDWAYSLRWYAAPGTGAAYCVDVWESVGPNRGVYAGRFGGFVDPSCLLIDKVACEPVLRLWCHPLSGDPSAMSTDRPVFAHLRAHGRGAGTGRATAYYTLSPSDVNHSNRLRWIASASSPAAPPPPPRPC